MTDGASSRRTQRIVQWSLTALLLVAVTWFLWSRRAELAAALRLDLAILLGISAGLALIVPANAVALKAMAARFGARIPMSEALLIALMGGLLNYLPLKAGTIAGGIVLRTRHRVPLTKYAALVTANYIVDLWLTAVFTGVVMLAIGYQQTVGWALVLAPSALVAALVAWGRTRSASTYFAGHTSRWARLLHSGIDGLRLLFADLRLITLLAGAQVVVVIGTAVQFYWGFQGVSSAVAAGQATIVAAVTIVAGGFGFLPGAFGFVEAGAAGTAAALGVAPALGLAAALIVRVVTLAWLIVLGTPATLYLSRLTGRSLVAAGEEGVPSEEPA